MKTNSPSHRLHAVARPCWERHMFQICNVVTSSGPMARDGCLNTNARLVFSILGTTSSEGALP